MIKFKQFIKLDSDILTEAIVIPRKVFRDIEKYIILIYDKINKEKLVHINDKIITPKEFNIDFTGTTWNFLNEVNPKIILAFNSSNKETYFNIEDLSNKQDDRNIKNGLGYISIDTKTKLHDILIATLEHELGHFIQYLLVTWKIKKHILPDIPIEEYSKYIGGIPSKRLLPTNLTTSGHKISDTKSWYITNPDLHSRSSVFTSKSRAISIKAISKEDAILKFKSKYPQYINDSSIIAIAKPPQRRVTHEKRPVEYYTNMLTYLRMLQYFYDSGLHVLSKKDYLKRVLTDHKPQQVYNFLQNMKKNSTPELYKRILNRFYNLFVNKDSFDKSDIQRIKADVDKYLKR